LAEISNPLADHVKEIDCYERKIDRSGRLVTSRLIACESPIPGWMEVLGVPTQMYAAETTVVDPEKKMMTIKSRNITGSSMLVVEETCVYSPHPISDSWTHYRQEAKITAFMPVVSRKFESYSLASVTQASSKGLRTIEGLCERVQKEGALALVRPLVSLRDSVLGSLEAASAVASAAAVTP